MRRPLRRLIPPEARRRLRQLQKEAPIRLRDLLQDLRDPFRPDRALPPARLRARVSGTSSRREFLDVGRMASADIRRAFEASKTPEDRYPRWLDFGCGSGRIARLIADYAPVEELWGADVDRKAVEWCSRHLRRGTYLTIDAEPPMPLPESRFDVIMCGSVFTHLPEEAQWRWLSELHRVLRPGGLLITCTHSPKLIFTRPDLTADQLRELETFGFLFAPGGGAFNEDGAFHTRAYLENGWKRWFRLELFEELGYCGFQDLSAWTRC